MLTLKQKNKQKNKQKFKQNFKQQKKEKITTFQKNYIRLHKAWLCILIIFMPINITFLESLIEDTDDSLSEDSNAESPDKKKKSMVKATVFMASAVAFILWYFYVYQQGGDPGMHSLFGDFFKYVGNYFDINDEKGIIMDKSFKCYHQMRLDFNRVEAEIRQKYQMHFLSDGSLQYAKEHLIPEGTYTQQRLDFAICRREQAIHDYIEEMTGVGFRKYAIGYMVLKFGGKLVARVLSEDCPQIMCSSSEDESDSDDNSILKQNKPKIKYLKAIVKGNVDSDGNFYDPRDYFHHPDWTDLPYPWNIVLPRELSSLTPFQQTLKDIIDFLKSLID